MEAITIEFASFGDDPLKHCIDKVGAIKWVAQMNRQTPPITLANKDDMFAFKRAWIEEDPAKPNSGIIKGEFANAPGVFPGASEEPDADQSIVGIVFLVVQKRDLERVIERLETLYGIRAEQYAGPITTMKLENWERFVQFAMIYLELPRGTWGNVVDWCSSAQRTGLVEQYSYAQVGGLVRKGHRGSKAKK